MWTLQWFANGTNGTNSESRSSCVQEAAERHHETKPRPENRGNQMDVHGEGHPGQARLQGSTARSRVSRGQGLHQDRCTLWIARRLFHDALSSSSKRLGLQRVRCTVSVSSIRRHLDTKIRLLGRSQSKCLLLLVRSTGGDGNHIKATQTRSTISLGCMSIELAGRTLESPLTNAEITGYRGVLGQLLWSGQQSRPDLCVGVSLAA